MKRAILILLLLIGNLYPQIKDVTRLPSQDSAEIYQESSPVIISDNEFLIFFFTRNYASNSQENDTLYSSRSTDGGKTWQDKKFILETKEAPAIYSNYLSSLRTSSGRIVIAFTDWDKRMMGIIYSDDDGHSWSDVIYVEGGGNSIELRRNSIYNLILSRLNDEKIILSFTNRYMYYTTYFRESSDGGETWSDSAYIFYQGGDPIRDSKFIPLQGEKVVSFFEFDNSMEKGIYKKISTDGGQTWGEESIIIELGLNVSRPRVIKISDENLWIVFQVKDTSLHNIFPDDIYYIKSTNGGETWSNRIRFTSYIGQDDFVNADRLGNKAFITFSSTRFTIKPQISYAVLGETIETFRPPLISNVRTFPDSISWKTGIINCEVIDDQIVANVTAEPDIGNPVTLFDDGKHNDIDSADNIFGNTLNLDQLPPMDMSFINVNKVNMPFDNKGIISLVTISVPVNTTIKATDNDQQQTIVNEELTINFNQIPQYDESSFLFSGGFFLSGYTHGELWTNAVATSALIGDYLPGKFGSEWNDPLNKVYVVRKEDTPFGYSWQQWKNAVSLGAEFYDGDGDGIYNPVDKNWNGTRDENEDMPMLIGDETAWCVYNDGLPQEARRWNTVEPQGIEIRQTIFASDNPELKNMIFIRYSILNTGIIADVMDSVYFGVWEDPDLGDFNDDLVGCDTLLNSGFVYNSGYDEYYGNNCPSFFTALLQGPVVQTGNSTDTAYNNFGEEIGNRVFTGAKNLNVTSHVFFIPEVPGSFNSAVEARCLLEGKYSYCEYVDPCTLPPEALRGGVDCHDINPVFWASGDPVADYGWMDIYPGDIRNLFGIGPFKLGKNKPQEIIIAYVLGRGTGPINSVTVTRENVRRAIQEYKSNFASMTYTAPPPANPVNSYRLYQNYPNPFNPVTKIRYELPQDGIVTIEIFDILGQKVKTLLNKFQKADRYEVEFNGTGLASGIYIYRLKVNDFITSKKMVHLK